MMAPQPAQNGRTESRENSTRYLHGAALAFKADAQKAKLEVEPTPGESVEKVVALIASTPAEMLKRLEEAVNPNR
jgi:hypothetical protein